MAELEFNVSGLSQLNAVLLELGTNAARRAGRKAQRQGANVILRAMRETAPVRTGNLKKKGFYTHDHGVVGDKVWFSVDLKKNAFYGKFLEFGTSKMAPHPFMRAAAEAASSSSVAVLAVVLGDAIVVEAERLAK